jgi:NAD+ diphosphatase
MAADGTAPEQEAREVAGDLGGFVLARGEVDRASARREDADWIAAAWADERTRVLVLDDGQALIRFGDGAAELVLVPPAQAPEGLKFLLGVDADTTAYFGLAGPARGLGAAPLPPPGTDMAPPVPGCAPGGGAAARRPDAGVFTHARWPAGATHTHCPVRRPTVLEPRPVRAALPGRGSEHFPRIGPAVIMLVTDDEDAAARAQPHVAPPGVHPGRFCGAGESAEQAVAREVRKTSIAVSGIGTCQPWPMPQN